MQYIPNEVYHIYNRGNNQQRIFFSERNYQFFIKKLELQLKPVCDILCWCLMPNHFHLIVNANENSCKSHSGFGNKEMQALSYRIRIMLSSYSQAINKQNKTTGSLFQQKTKSKVLTINKSYSKESYLLNAIHYCHQNAWKAGLVKKIEDWPYSSFPDYCGFRNNDLVNKELLWELTGYTMGNFYQESYGRIEGFDFEA